MSDESHPLVQLPGSERAPLATAAPAGQLDPSERAEVTLVLRRRADIPADIVEGPTVLTHDELAERYGADPADVELVRQTLTSLGLAVTEVHPATRRVKVAGPLGPLASAFGATLQQVSSPGPGGQMVTHRYREGPLYVPAALDGIVLAVLGLDTRPQARAHFRPRAAAAPGQTYPPNQVADIYQFPAGTTGAGQTIAVIELGGGFSTSDLDTYFGGLGIPVPSITAVGVDGGANAPGSDPTGADVEVALDVDVIGAAAPGAAQVVYFAPNSDQGFVDAISAAASGDPGARRHLHQLGPVRGLVDHPGTHRHGRGDGRRGRAGHHRVRGLRRQWQRRRRQRRPGARGLPGVQPARAGLRRDQAPRGPGHRRDQLRGRVERDGRQRGGGRRRHQRRVRPAVLAGERRGPGPVRARSSGSSGRGVPDVAGNADPATGYQIYSGGRAQVVGGTSAVAPLWAALVSRLAEGTGQRFGLIQTALYAGVTPGTEVAGFRDITSGNNGAYTAGPGWDACSGLGSPDGTALLTRLKG